MDVVTVSRDYRVVIPKSVRQQLGLVPGQRLQVFAHAGRVECIPVRPASELRGVLRGLDTSVKRDREDRV